jgi:hypothetical protein
VKSQRPPTARPTSPSWPPRSRRPAVVRLQQPLSELRPADPDDQAIVDAERRDNVLAHQLQHGPQDRLALVEPPLFDATARPAQVGQLATAHARGRERARSRRAAPCATVWFGQRCEHVNSVMTHLVKTSADACKTDRLDDVLRMPGEELVKLLGKGKLAEIRKGHEPRSTESGGAMLRADMRAPAKVQ